jgi:hypothetical protein
MSIGTTVHTIAKTEPIEKPFERRELLHAAAYGIALLWINVYICRELFFVQTAWMNSMHGFWSAVAQHAGSSWFRATWWPYWDCGIPFEFTYAPMIPALTAVWAAIRGIPHDLAFQCITGLAYCLVPFTLFIMAWLLTRAPAYAFTAALVYSLTAPTQLIAPDGALSVKSLWDARRFLTVAIWDDTPHLIALGLLPLVILFLSLSIQKRRYIFYWASAICISMATLASAFGPVMIAMAVACLLFVVRRKEYKRNLLMIIAIAACAYAVCAPFLSPSLIRAIGNAAGGSEGGWTIGSVTALAIVVLGWVALWKFLPHWTMDWRLFFSLFAYLTSSVPILAIYLNKKLLPQPGRYKLEMEFALSLLIVFASRCWFDRASQTLKAAVLFLLLALAGEQVVSHRQYAKNVLFPRNPSKTIEYRVAKWTEQNLPGERVMMPGSIAQWANAFTTTPQFSGSSWSMAYNQIQQRGLSGIYNGGDTPEQDARVSIPWLKAFGVSAIAVSGPKSQEYWKPFAHPTKFDGILPVLWRTEDVIIYRIPQRTESLAHVVSENALVMHSPLRPSDTTEIDRYVAALDDPLFPVAEMQWEARNRIRVRTSVAPGQAISVQVSHHSGWHASESGRKLDVRSDGLGLIWLSPGACSPCNITFDYDGGRELRVCRYLSFAAISGLLVLPLILLLSRLRASAT